MNQLVAVNPAATFTVSDVERVALAIAKGGLFGSKDPNAVLTLCLLAQAEGQHPAVVFRDYHIISGKPAKKAEAMLRDFINAGGKIEWHALTDDIADATFSHPYGGTARISWDHARAVKAQIAGNAMYKKYPRQMLRSRTISEGVRTIYPGATSGLYVEEEVSTFEGPALPATNQVAGITPPNEQPHQELIEGTAEPVKIPGIHKIKERLRTFRTAGDEAPTLEDFRKLVHGSRDDIKAIRDANHGWWTGDGEDFEGYEAWMQRRYAELAEPPEDSVYADLVRAMKECDTKLSLENWFTANEDEIDGLDDATRRTFDLAYELHESTIREMERVTAGA